MRGRTLVLVVFAASALGCLCSGNEDDTAADVDTGPGPGWWWNDDDSGWETDDHDRDGYDEGEDCDDDDRDIHPGASEACDGIDNDCDGAIDEAGDVPGVLYEDLDGDGYGTIAVEGCAEGDGKAAFGGDCDDADPRMHPGLAEVCANGLDDDCVEATPDTCGYALASLQDHALVEGNTYTSLWASSMEGSRDLDGDGVADLVSDQQILYGPIRSQAVGSSTAIGVDEESLWMSVATGEVGGDEGDVLVGYAGGAWLIRLRDQAAWSTSSRRRRAAACRSRTPRPPSPARAARRSARTSATAISTGTATSTSPGLWATGGCWCTPVRTWAR